MPNELSQALKSVLPWRAYSSLRRAWQHSVRISREGPLNAYRRWRLWCRILSTPPLPTAPPSADCDLAVHLMCHQGDYLCAIWALKSFYHHAKQALPLVIHVQGKSSARLRSRLRTHFPTARVILQQEADQIVEPYLRQRNLNRLLQKRRALSIMQKLTDILVVANSRKLLIIDADVLFFRRPEELLDVAATPAPTALFQRDYMEAYVTAPERARSDFQIDLRPRINTGIVAISRDVVDLERCEHYLGHPDFSPPDGHTEQTLYALEASRNQAVSYLPPSYLISANGKADYASLTARHYSSPSRVLFTREGIPHLLHCGFLRELGMEAARRTGQTAPANT